MANKVRSFSKTRCRDGFDYQTLEARQLLACDHVGDLGGGILVDDGAEGPGYIMYSDESVQNRFGLLEINADHFVAVRISGNQWQFNNNNAWVNFEPVDSDRLITEVDFSGDSVSNSVSFPIVNGILSSSRFAIGVSSQFLGREVESDLWFNANRFNGLPNIGEFEILGTCFDKNADVVVADEVGLQLEQINYGLLTYETVHQGFPSVATYDSMGRPLLSWRVEILPVIGYSDLYNQFNLDEPWNSPHNILLIDQMPAIFANSNVSAVGMTTYQALVGPGTLFDSVESPVQIRDIRDGTDNTLSIVEADADRAVFWTQPKDLEFVVDDPLNGLGQNGTASFRAITVSGLPLEFAGDTTGSAFSSLAQIADGGVVDMSNFRQQLDAEERLRRVGLAALNYQSAFGKYPQHAIYDSAGTNPLLSWRVAILPFIGHQNLYDQFHLDESWDSPHNLSLLPLIPLIFSEPAATDGFTTILATSGEGTIFELVNSSFGKNSISDGVSKTTLAVRANIDQAVEWTRPVDWVFNPEDPTRGLGSSEFEPNQRPESRGFYAVFADSTVRFISNQITDANFSAMVQRDDHVVVDFDDAPIEIRQDRNLHQLGIAARNFESVYGRFPFHATYTSDGSQSLLSWRVQLLPFLDEQVLYDQFNHDEPWDSPHNLALLDDMPEVFKSSSLGDGLTTFQALNGINTVFPITSELEVTFGRISDPLDQTILFAQTSPDSAVEWTRPLDIEFDANNPRSGLDGATESGFFVALVDGSVVFINDSVPDSDVAALAERNDGITISGTIKRAPGDVELVRNSSIQLSRINWAALDYQFANGAFPNHAIYSEASTDGVPLLSWRVSLLPFLGYGDLYDEFHLDEAWDSPHNITLLTRMPDVFAHPSIGGFKTLIQAVTTPRSVDNDGLPQSVFPVHFESSISLADVTDGHANTISFVEANFDQAVEWTRPVDLFYDESNTDSDPRDGFGESYFSWGNFASTVDGTARFLRRCLPASVARSLILANDGNVEPFANADQCPSGYRSDPVDSLGGFGNVFVNPNGFRVDSTDGRFGVLGNEFANFESQSRWYLQDLMGRVSKVDSNLGLIVNSQLPPRGQHAFADDFRTLDSVLNQFEEIDALFEDCCELDIQLNVFPL